MKLNLNFFKKREKPIKPIEFKDVSFITEIIINHEGHEFQYKGSRLGAKASDTAFQIVEFIDDKKDYTTSRILAQFPLSSAIIEVHREMRRIEVM